MNRRIAGAIAVVIAIVAALLLFFHFRTGEPTPQATTATRDGSPAIRRAATPKAQPEAAPPQQPAQRWTLDTDPEGPLRLEGQVLGPDGKGVGKGVVAIPTGAPPTATAGD